MPAPTTGFDPKRTALLVMDYQNGIVERLADPGPLVDRVRGTIGEVRRHGGTIGYVRVAFTEDDYATVPASNAGFAAQAQAIRVFDRRAELHKVSAPALVLVGAEDVLTPPSQAIEIAGLIPGARLAVLPRGSHGMIVEFPGPALAAIEEFLAG